MAFKTVLSVVTDAGLLPGSVDAARALAREGDAHLDVLCLGVDHTQTGYSYAGANALVLQDSLSRCWTEAEGLAAEVRMRLAGEDVRWGVEHGVVQLGDVGRHVAARARFSDLVALPQPYGAGRGVELESVLEGALFAAQVPVMVLPEGAAVSMKPGRVVLAWNESPEAMRAVRAALPLLRAAQTVHVTVIDPPRHGPERSDPGGMLSQFLARHAVRPEIDVLTRTVPRVSDVLLRHVTDVAADMVVMGAYGHSRFREAILGGATRDMLEKAHVPVLMAH